MEKNLFGYVSKDYSPESHKKYTDTCRIKQKQEGIRSVCHSTDIWAQPFSVLRKMLPLHISPFRVTNL